MQKIKIILGILLLINLNGCEQRPLTHDYLMLHPNFLQSEYEACNNNTTTDASCDVVKQAARDFMNLVNERSHDPEKFGKDILNMQIKVAELQTKTSSEEYQKAKQQLDVYLAVVAATSRE